MIGSPHLPLSPRGSILRSALALPSSFPVFPFPSYATPLPSTDFLSLSFHPQFCVLIFCLVVITGHPHCIPPHIHGHPTVLPSTPLFNSSLNPQPLIHSRASSPRLSTGRALTNDPSPPPHSGLPPPPVRNETFSLSPRGNGAVAFLFLFLILPLSHHRACVGGRLGAAHQQYTRSGLVQLRELPHPGFQSTQRSLPRPIDELPRQFIFQPGPSKTVSDCRVLFILPSSSPSIFYLTQ